MNAVTTFQGFIRADGKIGIRNDVLILSICALNNEAARRIAVTVAGTRLVTTPYGRGHLGPDRAVHERVLIGLAANPNVAAVLIIGPDDPAVAHVASALGPTGKPVEGLSSQEFQEDALALSMQGIRIAAHLVLRASKAQREPAPLSALFLGIECGQSDASSGMVANPLAGAVADRIVDAGGRAVVGETIEWMGAEDALLSRAVSPEVAQNIRDAVQRREQRAIASNVDLTGNNPGPQNIEGGLSTIEEKSLGAICKSGSRTINGVLEIAEYPDEPGLYLMDAPAFASESLTGMTAAGTQAVLFTTGPGNAYCSLLAPTIKLSANPETCLRLGDQLDFDAADVFGGNQTMNHATDRLLAHLVAVCSGTLTFGEILGEGAEAVIRKGALL